MQPKNAWLAEITRLHQVIKDGDRTYAREDEIVTAVGKARDHKATWQEIGDAMGTSRQYVHKRFYPQLEHRSKISDQTDPKDP